MAIAKWIPFGELAGFERDLNQVLNQAFTARQRMAASGSGSWSPLVDVHEDEDAFRVDMELPGFERSDVSVSLEDGTLTVSGERRYSDDAREKSAHRLERKYGSFSRSFSFPGQIEVAKITAAFENGLLTIVLPKSETMKPKQIDIG